MANSWLMLTTGSDRQHGGNEGYDDDPARYYSWDSTVPNHSRPSEGDFIALWDKKALLGVSAIASITEWKARKVLQRCPVCDRASIKIRRRRAPKYRCHNQKCLHEFEKPQTEEVEVHAYRSEHSSSWCDLGGQIGAADLRSLCTHPKSMLSIRELEWSRLRDRLDSVDWRASFDLIERSVVIANHGFGRRNVRVRKGQAAFRRLMLDRFGEVCAFTGSQPSQVLEAAHLYSYAALGNHQSHGGLMLRRDVHRLFDLGLLSVNPRDNTLDVHPGLRPYTAYADLHGKILSVAVNTGTATWLRLHWDQHRWCSASGRQTCGM